SLFLCNTSSNNLLETIVPEWNEIAHFKLSEKLNHINFPFKVEDIFPWKDQLSEGIDHSIFSASHLQQPYLFLRIRPGNEEIVTNKLAAANISFNAINKHCISLNNATKIDDVIEIDKEAVVQDLNSQRISAFFPFVKNDHPLNVWDCCAAS